MASTIIVKQSGNPDAAAFYLQAQSLFPTGRYFELDCRFDSAGVWGGAAELLEILWPEICSGGKDLIERHDYELARVVPWLLSEELEIRKTLTDAAPETERVRSYAADRALRIPHGIIDLILAWKKRSAPSTPWVLCGYDYGNAGPMAQLFYSELRRRVAEDIGMEVVLGVKRGPAEQIPDTCIVLEILGAPPQPPSYEQSCIEADQFEEEAESSVLHLLRRLPRLIGLSQDLGRVQRVVRLKLFALSHYCAEGFYRDALRYARDLLAESQQAYPTDKELHWTVAYKTLNAHLGAGNIEEAFQLATGECQKLAGNADSRMKSNLLYLQAMLYARFRQPRDLPRGEELLARAIEILDPHEMSSAEYHFARVFLANGLAMIRVFQKRHQEALFLCQQGMQEMNDHLAPTEHLLHRSVLVYNVAQVYSTLGDNDQAIAYLSDAIRLDPNYSEYFNERGNLYLARNDYSSALQDYQAAIRLSPPYPEVLVNLAQCHRLQQQHEEALALYDRALQLRPGTLLARIGRAHCLHQLSRLEEALAEYDEVLLLEPTLWEIYANRASLYYEVDRFAEALRDMDEAVRLNPHLPELAANRELILAAG